MTCNCIWRSISRVCNNTFRTYHIIPSFCIGTGAYITSNYSFTKDLVIRCNVGSSSNTKTWDDMIGTERVIAYTGNAPPDTITGHFTLIADALPVGTETFIYDGDTGVLLTDTVAYGKVRIIVKLENEAGILSPGVTIDYPAIATSSGTLTAPPPPSAARHNLTSEERRVG